MASKLDPMPMRISKAALAPIYLLIPSSTNITISPYGTQAFDSCPTGINSGIDQLKQKCHDGKDQPAGILRTSSVHFDRDQEEKSTRFAVQTSMTITRLLRLCLS